MRTYPRKVSFPAIASAVMALTLAGCDAAKKLIEPQPPVATTVELSQSSLALTFLGEQVGVTATVKDQNGKAMSGASVTWSSNDEAVATVSATGTVTALAVGSATVTAASGSINGTATVTITQEPAAVTLLDGDQQTATVGEQLTVDLVVQIDDGGGNPIEGEAVTFAVTEGGGSLTTEATATDASGQAVTTWTLGPASGTQEVIATSGNASGTFTASAMPDVAVEIAMESGDGQTGFTGSKLDDPIVVAIRDQFGNGVPGQEVSFSVTGGGGSLDSITAATDAEGHARTGWTMGSSTGTNTAEASAPGLTGDPIAFTATATNLSISGVSPDPMREGGSATITGTGFHATPANNTVLIDGVPATVTAASATRLDITVPAFDCRPARPVDVRVTVSSTSATSDGHPLEPASFLSLAVGEQRILSDPADFCLQFNDALVLEEYLIGVQSTSEVASSLTEVTLTGARDPSSTAPPAQASSSSAAPSGEWRSSPRAERLRRHRAAEAEFRQRDWQLLQSVAPAALEASGSPSRAPAVDSTVSVGDTLALRVRAQGDATCQTADSVTAVVKARGARGIWLSDVDNPSDGYSDADFLSLSDQLDTLIYATNYDHFGDPGDIDNNGRIVVLITKRVNERFPTLGFVSSCDMLNRDSFGASNQAEIFYGAAPDPSGSVNDAYSHDDALSDAPFIIAHELAHVIQVGRRMAASSGFATAWEMEGQATLAEEVVGHAFEGHAPGENLDYDVAFNKDDPSSIDWYSNAFVDLAYFFGYSSGGRVADAPEECSWLDQSFQSPCGGRALWYGVSWSFLRWLSDHYGPGFAGGERGLHQALIDASDAGFANIAGRVGVPIDSLLAQWSASLWVDDRVTTSNAKLTMSSWDLKDIFDNLVQTARLQPHTEAFDDFARTFSVRAASTAYTLVSGLLRPAVAIRARDASGAALPPKMQLYIVRTQ